MGLFQDINKEAQKRNLNFIVIDGIAVIMAVHTDQPFNIKPMARRRPSLEVPFEVAETRGEAVARRSVSDDRVLELTTNSRSELPESARMSSRKRQNESARPPDALNLELPYWSGMDSTSSRLSIDQAFELLDQYRKWFRDPLERAQRFRAPKCTVEFVL
jgi:hypothetical protein